MTAAEQVELFPVPAAYVAPLWTYTPNRQDVCVELDHLDTPPPTDGEQ